MVKKRAINQNGIAYPDAHCPQSESGAHWYVTVDKKSTWICKFCNVPVLIPWSWDEAFKFGTELRYKGIEEAYHNLVECTPGAKEKLSRLWKAKELIDRNSRRK